MILIEAIKEITAKYGTIIVPTKQFVNLLDDIGGFKESPAASKKIMKGLLESGYGELAYRIAEQRHLVPNWQNEVRKSISSYIAKSGYKDEIINSLASQLLFALGIISEMPKVESPSTPKAQSSRNVIKDPKELLYSLKEDYTRALSDLLTITNDEYGYKYGFYSSDAETQLYVLEQKIHLVAKELENNEVTSWMAEEKSKVILRNRPTPAQIKQALDELFSHLEQEYKSLMEQGVIIEDDEFGLKSATFPQNVVSDLASIEKKIITIGARRKEDRNDWIAKTKSDFLASKSSPVSVRQGALDQLKSDYSSRLDYLDKETKSGEIDFHDSDLREIRRKLINLGTLLHKDMEKWCDIENQKLSEERTNIAAKKKKRNIILSAAAGVTLLFGGWEGTSYLSSVDNRAAYEQTMALAEQAYQKEDYPQALTLFQKAEDDYTSSYSSSSYKGKAHKKAVETSDKIIANWSQKVIPLIKEKRVAKAQMLTLALPKDLVLEGTSEKNYKNITTQIDEGLKIRSSQLVSELFNEIYTNHGQLSSSKKTELDEMLEVDTNNYWLNFIKSKVK